MDSRALDYRVLVGPVGFLRRWTLAGWSGVSGVLASLAIYAVWYVRVGVAPLDVVGLMWTASILFVVIVVVIRMSMYWAFVSSLRVDSTGLVVDGKWCKLSLAPDDVSACCVFEWWLGEGAYERLYDPAEFHYSSGLHSVELLVLSRSGERISIVPRRREIDGLIHSVARVLGYTAEESQSRLSAATSILKRPDLEDVSSGVTDSNRFPMFLFLGVWFVLATLFFWATRWLLLT